MRWARYPNKRRVLVSDKTQVQVSIVPAGFSHFLDLLPSFFLRIVSCPLADSIPLFQKAVDLKVVENRLAKWIDAPQKEEIAVIPRGNNAMQHDPIAALPEIVFQLHYPRHVQASKQRNSARECINVTGIFQTKQEREVSSATIVSLCVRQVRFVIE
jgi:hypothetical protein